MKGSYTNQFYLLPSIRIHKGGGFYTTLEFAWFRWYWGFIWHNKKVDKLYEATEINKNEGGEKNMKTWEEYKKYVKENDPLAAQDLRECEDLAGCEEIEITLTAKFLISDNAVILESGVLHPWFNAEVLHERKASDRETFLIRKIINRTFQDLYGVNLKGFINEYFNAENKSRIVCGKEIESIVHVGNHYVTAIEDIGIERTDVHGNQVICKGYYCQVYDNADLKNEVDNFCLAVGYEIEDMSEESLEAGIRHYMGEEETEGFSQQI